MDFADHRRLETLRADEAKYRGMFENCVEGIFQTTPSGQYLNVNPALARIYGYDSPQQLMTELNDIGAQLYVRENRRNEFKELIAQQEFVTDFESEIYCKDGSVIWISENSRAIYDAQGVLRCYEGTVMDITRRKLAEADEAKYRGMFENCVEGIFQTTPAGQYLNVNPALARIYGYDSPQQLMTELNDIGAQLYVRENRRNEFKELIEGQGFVTDFESEIRRKDGSVIWISENSRAIYDDQGKVRCYEGTVMDITRRKLAETDLESTQRQLLATRDVSVFALAKLAESRDPETGEHLERMRTYSQLLAEHLSRQGPYVDQIDDTFLEDLFRSSPLHDIGKVAIPDAILLKPGRFTPEEFKLMQAHAEIGAETLESALRHSGDGSFLRMAAGIARWHHERFDGKGYPDGLAGLDIPLAARIVALADVYDALTSARVYKAAYDPRQARDMIIAASGTQFDAAVVDAFRICYPDFLRWQGIEPGLLAELLLEALDHEGSMALPQQSDRADEGAHQQALAGSPR